MILSKKLSFWIHFAKIWEFYIFWAPEMLFFEDFIHFH